MKKKTKKSNKIAIILIMLIIAGISTYFEKQNQTVNEVNNISYEISNIPEYNEKLYIEINRYYIIGIVTSTSDNSFTFEYVTEKIDKKYNRKKSTRKANPPTNKYLKNWMNILSVSSFNRVLIFKSIKITIIILP